MDFDPRDYDSRDEDRFALTRDRRDVGPHLNRGPGDSRESPSRERDRDRDDARSRDIDGDERMRDTNRRDAFTRHLDLPRRHGRASMWTGAECQPEKRCDATIPVARVFGVEVPPI